MSTGVSVFLNYNNVYLWCYDVRMDQILKERATLFSKYISEEIRGAIAAKGHSQRQVATEIQRQPKNLSQWLSGDRQIPMDVAYQICDFIGIEIQTIITRAEQDVVKELGPWPPIKINPSALTDDERRRLAIADLHLAANDNPDKEAERDYYPDAGA